MARFVFVYGRGRNPGWHNYHLHFGFFEKAFLSHGHEVVYYGPKKDGLDAGPLPYDRRLTTAQVIDKLGGDVYVHMEEPLAREMLSIVPPSIPSVSYVVDLHRANDPSYVKLADAVVFRGSPYGAQIRKLRRKVGKRKTMFLPFSFDEQVASSVPEPKERERKIAFCGAKRPEHYPLRFKLLPVLKKAKLLSSNSAVSPALPYAKYLATYKQAVSALACTGKLGFAHAKHVEICACNTLLFSNGSPFLDAVLPTDCYVRYNEKNLLSLVRHWVHPNQDGERAEMSKRAFDYVWEHDTDTVRGRQLMKWFGDLGFV